MSATFRIALTADFYDAAGAPKYRDFGLSVLDGVRGVQYAPLAEPRGELTPADLGPGVNGVLVLTPRVTAASLAAADDLLCVARFGVGYDGVDVAACTERDVVLTIARGAVDRSVAEATVAWMLALSHRIKAKDRLVREMRWNDRSQFMGWELRGRTLGIVGCGGIARELLRLLSVFGMDPPLIFDPYVTPETAAALGARKVQLDELLREADFVSLHCPLNDETRGLIGTREFGRMRSSAVLINTARGGIVDEDALLAALRAGRIAGAAVDCFAAEPVETPHPLAEFDNVLLAPHAIAWTDELFQEIGRTACRSLADLALGRRPHGVVNPEVFDRPTFVEKWTRLQLAPNS
jgi:phosphoglycerate dehydrogenase-like enzyme